MSDNVLEPNTLDDEDDWKDIEPDNIVASFISFSGNNRFRRLEEFFVDAKENHGVDLIEMKQLYGTYEPTYL